MKYKIVFTTTIALLINSQIVAAGAILDSYAKGDTLTAQKMDAIKSAVNDNDLNISNNTIIVDTKQDRVTGTCSIGQAIREINDDGTVTCSAAKTHYLVISSTAFRPHTSDTVYGGNGINPYNNLTGGTLEAVAPVNLPHGAVITGFDARIWDASSTNSISVELRKFTGSATTTSISSLATTNAGNSGFYDEVDNSINEAVDLSATPITFYYLLMKLPAAALVSGPTLYAARITYTY